MIKSGEIPLRLRYEKSLDLDHQARLELTKNFAEEKTYEFIREFLS